MDPGTHPIGRLYEETGFLVYRRCLRVLGDPQEALDVTQYSYMRAIEIGFEVRTRGEALAWLYRTATQRCLTLLRKHGTRTRIREAHAEFLAATPPTSPERQAVGRDLLERVVARVDERTAEIALLTWGEGLSSARAAEVCGVSLRTVARARSTFAEVLEALHTEEER